MKCRISIACLHHAAVAVYLRVPVSPRKQLIRAFAAFPVEPESGDDTRQSLIKGECVTIPPPSTIADGLRVQVPGTLTFPILRQNAEDVLTVSDDEIGETLRFILFRMKMLVEPSGVAAAAAVFANKLPLIQNALAWCFRAATSTLSC